jgi:hypothetical protein
MKLMRLGVVWVNPSFVEFRIAPTKVERRSFDDTRNNERIGRECLGEGR